MAGCCVASCPTPPQLLVTLPPPVWWCLHLSTSCPSATFHCAPHLLWCGCLSSTPAVCRVTSLYTATSCLPAPPPLIVPPPLIALLSCLLSSCLSRCLSSHQCLQSASASDSRCASPLVAPPLCLSSTLAGCRVASPHDGTLRLPAPMPPRNFLQAMG
jgi:hypothetical protein